MSKSANIIVKCPGCSEKFEVEREAGPTFVSCPECEMQIKVSGTEERRGQATRKLMAKVNSLPTPKRNDDSAVSDLSFGRSLPFSPAGNKSGKSSGKVDELSIDADDDEFLKSLSSEESASETKTPVVTPKKQDAPIKRNDKKAEAPKPIKDVPIVARRTPSLKAQSAAKILSQASKPISGERATSIPTKKKDGPVFEGRDFHAEPKLESNKETIAESKEPASTPIAKKESNEKRSTSRRERRDERKSTRKTVTTVPKDSETKSKAILPPPKPDKDAENKPDKDAEVVSTGDMEKIQVDSRGQRRRLKNAPKAEVPMAKDRADTIDPALEIERKKKAKADHEKLFPNQEFGERKVTEGAEWRRHKPSRIADPDWEAEDEDEYYTEDEDIVSVKSHRAVVLGVGAAMALLGLWAGFQFMTTRMGDQTPAADAEATRPDIAVEARRDWTSVSLLPKAEPVIAKFLASRSNEEALQYVRRANKVSFMMKKHYMPSSFTPLEVVEIGPAEDCAVVEGKFFVVPVTLRDFSKVGVALEIPQGNEQEWKVDWESFAGYSEMSFPEMRIRRPTYPVLVRCYLLQDTYHNYDFADAEKYVSFRLFDHSRADQMWGYVVHNSPTYNKLATTMVNTGSKVAEQIVTLRVRFPNSVTNPLADQVEIVEFVTFGWVVHVDLGSAPIYSVTVMSSLAHKVRGEFVPVDQSNLHLLEIVYDEQQNPFWKARCLQTGKVLRVALDGAVQQAMAGNLNLGGIDYLNQRRQTRGRKRLVLVLLSVGLAAAAFVFRDQLQPYWERALAFVPERASAVLERILP